MVSIRRHQSTIDIKYGSLNQPHILQAQIERVSDEDSFRIDDNLFLYLHLGTRLCSINWTLSKFYWSKFDIGIGRKE